MPLTEPLNGLMAEIETCAPVRSMGRVVRVDGSVVHIAGLSDTAQIGAGRGGAIA